MSTKTSSSIMMISALGVVFGDIGTSPLYAFKECLKVLDNLSLELILGVLSLIFWSITLVVTVKYVMLVMKANNKGEGGILSLMSLASQNTPFNYKYGIFMVGLMGAAMFYGDSMITPAISILSAVEGLSLVSTKFTQFILPIVLGIVVGLFWVQKSGTAKIGRWFGPAMLVWFLCLALLGLKEIINYPKVLLAVNPLYAFELIYAHPHMFFLAMAGVFLTITGGEALYADMGHFGRTPIKQAWVYLVFPSLMLNYFGQGALVLRTNIIPENPFFSLSPSWALVPLVFLATLATVIASQAVISGAFSMTKQAILLGYLPRLNIIHTSSKEVGQIYLPSINNTLLVAVLFLVFFFKTSDNLAAAYGIAVSTTMFLTTLLLSLVAFYKWKWSHTKVLSVIVAMSILDIIFIWSNSEKILAGGWFPLMIGSIYLLLMTTWKKGRHLVLFQLAKGNFPLKEFICQTFKNNHINKAKGTAVYLSSIYGITPNALVHNLKHNQVLHDTNIFMNFEVQESPYWANDSRLAIDSLTHCCWQVKVKIGFKESPNVPHFLEMVQAQVQNWTYDENKTSFFLSRESIVADRKVPGMAYWREKIYIFMSKNAVKAADYFHLPRDRVIEIGSQVTI